MTRVCLLVTIILLISVKSFGQCLDPPTVTLSSTSGSTCGKVPLTISNNTFGGSAKGVTITTNGTGTVNPGSTGKQPFDIAYTPSDGDIGLKVLITVTTNIPKDPQCLVATASYLLTVNANPRIPVVGTREQPSCASSVGSVGLSDLPSIGSWTLIRNPGAVTTTGYGSTTTISDLAPGSYTFSVIDISGCTSSASGAVVINPQPPSPAAPVIGTITHPTCTVFTGSLGLSGLPSSGSWTITRNPGSVTTTGSGSSTIISGLPSGTYTFIITNLAGCTSVSSGSAVINSQPPAPSAPIIGTITQPHTGVPTGTVVLNGLPGTGSWTLSLTPGNVATSGSGVTKTIAGLSSGTYSFTVTNSSGCISGSSANFTISSNTGAPDVVITNPAPVCGPKTIDITAPGITAGSSPGLAYTYWVNAAATIKYNTPSIATSGTYYIKGTAADGFFLIKPVTVSIYQIPLANAGPNQVLANKYGSTMNAQLTHNYEYGIWSLISGSGQFFDATYTKSTISGLSAGKNLFLWTVSNGVCPSSSDTVMINIHDQVVPTLITPNMDGKNDYLVLKGTDLSGKREIVIFDRRGVEVYKNKNYDNSWNGIDYNGNPLPDDTYFYVLTENDGNSLAGYILIRR